MAQLRRFLVFQAFLLWQGGFVFYAAVVVPIGTELHGSHAQGLVTQRVTHWLNAFGVVWHLVFAWELWANETRHQRIRFLGWLASLVMLIVLIAVHEVMDQALLNGSANFKMYHIIYLLTSTIQWLIALVLSWLMFANDTQAG